MGEELERVRVPALKKAPPLLLLLLDPVTVTPEIVKLAPVSIMKILKLPWLASMVSEEAPKPVMVRVPEVDASKMFGNVETMVMV